MDSEFLQSIGFFGISADSSANALLDISGFDGLLPGANGADVCIDTVLRLNSPGSRVMKRKWACADGNISQQTPLVLGVGHYSSSLSEGKSSSATAPFEFTFSKGIEEQSSVDLDLEFSLQLGREISYSSKKTSANINPPRKMVEVDLELSLSTWPSVSDITSVHGRSSMMQIDIEKPLGVAVTQLDEKSSSSLAKTEDLLPSFPARTDSFSFASVLSASATPPATPKSSFNCTSKLCKFTGCSRGARGACGLCISHGGGRRCQRPGCEKGAEGKTSFCKGHGGGKRCQFLGCIKSAEGHTELCIAHGGGRRCSHEGCTKASRGKSGLCIRHGGGKRCKREDCTKSAEGISGLCISHGGGRRCQYPACTKGSQGSTKFCKAHGGGKRCTILGCIKGAEGRTLLCKSHGGGKRCSFLNCPKCVHGGTSFCVAHGGGKRCASFGCSKSARGRTDFCVRHGGGKRCKVQSCGKSAQGSTDFCKAHGGGGCKTIVCSVLGDSFKDKRIHGGITLGPLLQVPEGRVHGGSLLAILKGGSG